MKKIFLAVVILTCLFTTHQYANAQDPHCNDIQASLERAGKEGTEVRARIAALDYSISIMEDDIPDMSSLNAELKITNNSISTLQAKIAGGDKSDESAAELQSLRNRSELLRMRMSNDYNKNTFYKQPKFLQLKKDLSNAKDVEFDNKREIADLESKQKAYNCPTAAKKVTDEPEIATELEGWAANWKSSDPKNKEMIIRMVLNGSGNSVSGTLSFPAGEGLKTEYQIRGCNETSPNKLNCAFTATLEDYEKYMDLKGTVEMTLTANSINSNWKETGSPAVRWKPGHEREVTPRPPLSFSIPFTRE